MRCRGYNLSQSTHLLSPRVALQDQVYQMGDYILRLETALSHARRAATVNLSPEISESKQMSLLILAQQCVVTTKRREGRACCRLALWSWAGACANLRAKRYAIMRFVTKSSRSKASQALCVWIRGRRMQRQVHTTGDMVAWQKFSLRCCKLQSKALPVN